MAYETYSATSNSATTAAEIVTLALIFASFLILAYLAAKVKTFKSFQGEMFLFSLVLVVSEVPRVLGSLGLISLAGFGDLGLELHSVAMVVLTLFVAIRTYRFFRS